MKKILLILTLFMALTVVKAQSVYHLSIDGNQLVIENVTNSTTLAYPANNVYILQNASSETFGLYSFKGTSLGGGYSLANVRDADGVAFASFAILVDWLNKSLGGDILAPSRSYNFVANANKTGAYMRGNFTVQSQGTYGSGSMNLQYSYDNTDWTTISTFTTDTVRNIEVAGYIRTTLTGATAPNLDVTIQQIK